MLARAGFLTVAILLLLAPSAAARLSADITTSGALTVSWHGDPARGCADMGVCDITGSLALRADGDEGSASSSSNDLLQLLEVSTGAATIRVLRGAPDAPQGVCLDRSGFTTLELTRTRTGVRLGSDLGFGFGGPISAGRCAGPLPADIAPAFPRATVSSRRLRGRSVRLDFAGRRAFTAGAFSGEVVSTLAVRARVTRSRTPSQSQSQSTLPPGVLPRRVPARSRRVTVVQLAYRAVPAPDALTIGFRPSGRCEDLDACGLDGTVAVTGSDPAAFAVEGVVPLAAGRRPSLAAALAALRAGRGSLVVEPGATGMKGRVVTAVARDGASVCHDARTVALPLLTGARRGRSLALALGAPQYGEPEDVLRSRCPGPSRSVQRDGALAAGTVALADLGKPTLDVRLTGRAGRDPGFAQSTSGALRWTLRRTARSVRAERRSSGL